MEKICYKNLAVDGLGIKVKGKLIDEVSLEIMYFYQEEEPSCLDYPGHPEYIDLLKVSVLYASIWDTGEVVEVTEEDEKDILSKIDEEKIITLCWEDWEETNELYHV